MGARIGSRSRNRHLEYACRSVIKSLALGGVLIASPALAQAVNSQWQATGGGYWDDSANWSNGVPDSLDSTAIFGASIGSPSDVTLYTSHTVSGLTFNNASFAYTLTPGNYGTLVLASTSTSSATVTDQAGAQFITAPVIIDSPTEASVANSGDTLSVSNATFAGGALSFSGAGTLAFGAINVSSPASIAVANTTIGEGSLNLGALTINAPVDFGGPVSGTVSAIQISSVSPAMTVDQGSATYGADDYAAVNTAAGPGQVLPGSAVAGFYSPVNSGPGVTPFPGGYEVNQIQFGGVPQAKNIDVNAPGEIELEGNYVAQTIRFNTPNGGFVNGNSFDELLIASLSTTGILVTPNVQGNVVIAPQSAAYNQQTQRLTSVEPSTSPAMVIWQNNVNGILVLNTGLRDPVPEVLSLTTDGPGAVAIMATSTYTGSTHIDGGSLQVPYNGALGEIGEITINGESLVATQTMTLDGGNAPISQGLVIGANGGNLTAAVGQTLTMDDVLLGNGMLSIGNAAFFSVALGFASGNALQFAETSGAGQVVLAGDVSQFSGGISVAAGSLTVAPSYGTLTPSSVSVSAGAFLDIAQNDALVIKYASQASDPIATIQSYLRNGYNGANASNEFSGYDSSIGAIWTSSGPTVGLLAVGYADGDTDVGTPAGPNQLYLKTTLAGDANLDGTVNFADLLVVAQNFNHPVDTHGNPIDWADGDFNYDGLVNFADLLAVAQNFNETLNSSQLAQLPTSFAADWQLAEAEVQAGESDNVPEPATVSLLAIGAAGLLARRRRVATMRNEKC